MNVRMSAPVEAFQRRAEQSAPPVRTLVPSGEQATEKTGPECPESTSSQAPVAAFQILAVESELAVNTREPLEENATQ